MIQYRPNDYPNEKPILSTRMNESSYNLPYYLFTTTMTTSYGDAGEDLLA